MSEAVGRPGEDEAHRLIGRPVVYYARRNPGTARGHPGSCAAYHLLLLPPTLAIDLPYDAAVPDQPLHIRVSNMDIWYEDDKLLRTEHANSCEVQGSARTAVKP